MFNDMSPQEQMAAVREMLNAQGAPVNTTNLNRAMAALSQGQSQLPAMGAADRHAPTARHRATPQVPAAAAATAPMSAPVANAAPPVINSADNAAAVTAANVPAAVSGMDSTLEAMMGNGPRSSVENFMGGDAVPVASASEELPTPPIPLRGDAVAARVASGRRIGSANGATRIDENAPDSGMFNGGQDRLASDVESPTGLGLTLLAMGAGGLGTAARLGAPAAESLGAQAGRLVAGDRAVRTAETTQAAQQAASRSLAEQARAGTRGATQAKPAPATAPQAPTAPRDNTLIPSSGRPDIVPGPRNMPVGPPSVAEIAAMSGRNMQGGGRNLAQGPRRGTQGTTPESPSTMNVPASVREAMRRRVFESIR